jgi:hypothetical protein
MKETLDLTFAMYKLPENDKLDIPGLMARFKAYQQAANSCRAVANLLFNNKDCKIKYEDSSGIIVTGPRHKLARYLQGYEVKAEVAHTGDADTAQD